MAIRPSLPPNHTYDKARADSPFLEVGRIRGPDFDLLVNAVIRPPLPPLPFHFIAVALYSDEVLTYKVPKTPDELKEDQALRIPTENGPAEWLSRPAQVQLWKVMRGPTCPVQQTNCLMPRSTGTGETLSLHFLPPVAKDPNTGQPIPPPPGLKQQLMCVTPPKISFWDYVTGVLTRVVDNSTPLARAIGTPGPDPSAPNDRFIVASGPIIRDPTLLVKPVSACSIMVLTASWEFGLLATGSGDSEKDHLRTQVKLSQKEVDEPDEKEKDEQFIPLDFCADDREEKTLFVLDNRSTIHLCRVERDEDGDHCLSEFGTFKITPERSECTSSGGPSDISDSPTRPAKSTRVEWLYFTPGDQPQLIAASRTRILLCSVIYNGDMVSHLEVKHTIPFKGEPPVVSNGEMYFGGQDFASFLGPPVGPYYISGCSLEKLCDMPGRLTFKAVDYNRRIVVASESHSYILLRLAAS